VGVSRERERAAALERGEGGRGIEFISLLKIEWLYTYIASLLLVLGDLAPKKSRLTLQETIRRVLLDSDCPFTSKTILFPNKLDPIS
jgi:hypothetical protein